MKLSEWAAERVKNWVNPVTMTLGQTAPRQYPELYGPLYVRPKEQLVLDGEVISKEYVDDFSGGAGRLNQSMRQPYIVGRYYGTSFGLRRQATTHADGDCRMSALYTSVDITIDQLAIDVSTGAGGSTARLGIYALAPETLLPSALLLDAGTVDTAAAAIKTLSCSLVVTGPAWLGLAVSVLGGSLGIISDRNVSCVAQVPYGFTDVPLDTAITTGYALLVTGAAGALPSPVDLVATSTSVFGSGVLLRRSA